jgi:hypothetical protein
LYKFEQLWLTFFLDILDFEEKYIPHAAQGESPFVQISKIGQRMAAPQTGAGPEIQNNGLRSFLS